MEYFVGCLSFSVQQASVNPATIIAMLPLFFEKADFPAIVRQGMNLLKIITEFLNLDHIPIIAYDCLIFSLYKYIQWQWPEDFSENKFIVMLGGLHAEKVLWICLGNL